MSKKNLSSRNAYWDNFKGILIALVVLGHYLYAYYNGNATSFAGVIVSIVYSFHMPAFIFISGFFSQSENAVKLKSITKLAFAYILFNFSMAGFTFLFEGTKISLLQPYYSYWYILAIIFWRLSIKSLNKVKGIVAISIVVALLIGFMDEFSNVLALGRIVSFFPFFLIGYRFKREKAEMFISDRKVIVKLSGSIMALAAVFVAYKAIYSFGISSTDLLMGGYRNAQDIVVRAVIFIVAGLFIIVMGLALPSTSVPFIGKWGRNSLTIYLFHRVFTLIFERFFPVDQYNRYYLLYALAASAVTLLILGTDFLSKFLNTGLEKLSEIIIGEKEEVNNRKPDLLKTGLAFLLIAFLLIAPAQIAWNSLNSDKDSDMVSEKTDTIHPVISTSQTEAVEGAVTIAFVGDLILLQDQVKYALNNEPVEQQFDSLFAYTKKYLTNADYAIGVFEGPMAGEEAGYSSSNVDDGLPLHLNFPDSFAQAVKNAGIDFVTTANNHLLDKDETGAMRTLDILDEIGLDHTGSFRNQEEKNAVKVINIKGLRIAVLAYTYGSNYHTEDEFLTTNTSITSILCDPESKNFDDVKAGVIRDVENAKRESVDLIMVLPHMGAYLSHVPDNYQKIWNSIFVEAGADLILGDHSHAVQPVEFHSSTSVSGNKKTALVVNSPGNFVNSYLEEDGDATSIVEIYLDQNTGSVIGASVIPMWTHSTLNGGYRALPIFEIMNNPNLKNQISTHDKNRINEVHGIITSVMLGEKLPLDQLQERYYLFSSGYVRTKATPLVINEAQKSTLLYKELISVSSVCFVGDSITAGTKNGGYGWYEPLAESFPNLEVTREAWGGATTKTLLSNVNAIAAHKSDLYILAIGTNDVRYRDETICSMTAESFVDSIRLLISQIKTINPNASFAFVSPWLAQDNDPHTKLSVEKRDAMLAEYGNSLQNFCRETGYIFINPNTSLNETLKQYVVSDYMVDHIHPNANQGIRLYSNAVISFE